MRNPHCRSGARSRLGPSRLADCPCSGCDIRTDQQSSVRYPCARSGEIKQPVRVFSSSVVFECCNRSGDGRLARTHATRADVELRRADSRITLAELRPGMTTGRDCKGSGGGRARWLLGPTNRRRAPVVGGSVELQRVGWGTGGFRAEAGQADRPGPTRTAPNCTNPEGCRVFRATAATPEQAGPATTLEFATSAPGVRPISWRPPRPRTVRTRRHRLSGCHAANAAAARRDLPTATAARSRQG